MQEERYIRINKVLRELNISLENAVSFLKAADIHIDANPNTKISVEEYNFLRLRVGLKAYKPKVQPEITNPEIARRIRLTKGIPKTVFKYFGTQNYHLSSLREGYLFHSNFNDFNDPFDCNIKLIDFEKLGKSKKDKSLEKTIRERFPNIGICCFSRIHDSILMWSHYANNHKGFCIEFYSNKRPIGINPLDVNYTESFVKANFYNEQQKALFHMVFTKAKQWEYEQELRSIVTHFKDNNSRKVPFLKEDVKAVFLGVNCDDNFLNEILSIVKEVYNNAITVYRGSLSPHSFEIQWQEIKLSN